MAEDPAFKAHQEWIRPLGGEGLVVSATALTDALVFLPPDDRLKELSAQFEEALFIAKEDSGEERVDLPLFEKLVGLLGWDDEEVIWDHKEVRLPDELSITIDGTTIKPTHVLVDSSGAPAVLVIQLAGSPDLLQRSREGAGDWDASHAQRMERLLREKKVEIGIIITATEIRLFYVPATGGENPGSISFPLSEMRGVRGRPTLGAVFMLLERARVVGENTPEAHRLLGLMRASREAQNRVSEELADQVLGALYELIKGIQVADQAAHRKLISKYLNEHPEEVYHGLLNVLMRLIFMLYAEDRGIMPQGGLWQDNYEVHGLFERLQKENVQHAGNMDKRYGAWGQLLTTFKVVHDGCQHPLMKMPARMGYLFDPRRYPFVSADSDGNVPLVSDAVVLFVLKSLLVVKGERISYRSLNVENIGVVYETMMGFSIYQSKGSCVVMKGAEAPVAVELEELMAGPASSRAQMISDMTGWKPNAKVAKAIKEARDTKELLVILEDRIRKDITPTPLAAGGLTLQPGEERRRSGSHYTPRALTEPLVSKAFEPHFARFGEKPTPEQILSLTVCDPAMGSGAFLVEATRQLAAKLVEAWKREPGKMPKLGTGDDIEFVALRTIAQRCIYGVDRNPMAVDLAKLSLWLLTISKDHPFTFMDHSLKHGDALVGMSKEQIRKFHWELSRGGSILPELRTLDREVEEAVQARLMLRNLDADRTLELEVKLAEADAKMAKAKQAGDLLVYIWFSQEKERARNEARDRYTDRFAEALQHGSPERNEMASLRYASSPLAPFHWELEYPEVFSQGGFAVFIGNPPFISGGDISGVAGALYLEYLQSFLGHFGQADVVADFFNRSYLHLNALGTMGLIATNSICSGDTKRTSLDRIVTSGGVIYYATRGTLWPGKAAVYVATVAVARFEINRTKLLDGVEVSSINPQLCSDGDGLIPGPIAKNSRKSFSGFYNYGNGFVFKDGDSDCNSLQELERILTSDPSAAEIIHPFITGDDILSHYPKSITSQVIDVDHMDLKELKSSHPEIFNLLQAKVKPMREKCNRERIRDLWWKYGETRPGLRSVMKNRKRVLVAPFLCTNLAIIFVDSGTYVSSPNVVFDFDDFGTFAILQSAVHNVWFQRFGSKLGKGKRYTASDCFVNFPFPEGYELNQKLNATGEAYYKSREGILTENKIGLTSLYREILGTSPDQSITAGLCDLQKQHAMLNKAVLDAYGWHDILIPDGEKGAVLPPLVRDEILRRLLALHAEHLKAEQTTPSLAGKADKKTRKPKKSKDSSGPDLFNL